MRNVGTSGHEAILAKCKLVRFEAKGKGPTLADGLTLYKLQRSTDMQSRDLYEQG